MPWWFDPWGQGHAGGKVQSCGFFDWVVGLTLGRYDQRPKAKPLCFGQPKLSVLAITTATPKHDGMNDRPIHAPAAGHGIVAPMRPLIGFKRLSRLLSPCERPFRFMALAALTLFTGCLVPALIGQPTASELSFVVAGDMRSFGINPSDNGKRFFDGACEAMRRVGPGRFLISPGDFDPPAANRAIIDQYLGADFPWYLVVGNHEVENAAVMPWVRTWLAADIPHVVRRGLPGTPLTIYSWAVGNSHFIAIDSYPWAKPGTPGDTDKAKSGSKGNVDLTDATFRWLEEELAAVTLPFIWVTGHQPLESLPDMDSGRVRHPGESVSADPDRAERFATLLRKFRVRAYLCGHTHNTSVVKLKTGIWQADSGHARGGGDAGSPSTFLKIRTAGDQAWVDIYRADPTGTDYRLRQTVTLD